MASAPSPQTRGLLFADLAAPQPPWFAAVAKDFIFARIAGISRRPPRRSERNRDQIDTGRPARRIDSMEAQRSQAWHLTFRLVYAILRATDHVFRSSWLNGALGITSLLTVRGRQTGRERSVLVGLIQVNERWYVGHPNGNVAWTMNLRHARRARLALVAHSSIDVSAEPLAPGEERDGVIHAAGEQQPFPANVLYRAARATS